MSLFSQLEDLFGNASESMMGASGGSAVEVSDSDVPSGSGGINREGYTYGELRRQPIVPEVMALIRDAGVRRIAQEVNDRCRRSPFVMRRVNGEYCFDGLHVGPKINLPTAAEYRRHFGNVRINASMLRDYNYTLMRKAIASACGISEEAARYAIGNQLVCIPHEDISGKMFLVPEWAHCWFRHDGYVSRVLAELY